jgi:hypothetical protein
LEKKKVRDRNKGIGREGEPSALVKGKKKTSSPLGLLKLLARPALLPLSFLRGADIVKRKKTPSRSRRQREGLLDLWEDCCAIRKENVQKNGTREGEYDKSLTIL